MEISYITFTTKNIILGCLVESISGIICLAANHVILFITLLGYICGKCRISQNIWCYFMEQLCSIIMVILWVEGIFSNLQATLLELLILFESRCTTKHHTKFITGGGLKHTSLRNPPIFPEVVWYHPSIWQYTDYVKYRMGYLIFDMKKLMAPVI